MTPPQPRSLGDTNAAELAGDAIADLARRSAHFNAERAAARLNEASKVLASIREERAKPRGDLPGLPNTVEASRHDDRWLARFWELYKNTGVPSAIWTLHDDRVLPPEAVAAAAQCAIIQKTKELEHLVPQLGKPWWLPLLCANRDSFSSCALHFTSQDEDEPDYHNVLLPAYASQQPEKVFFIEARRLGVADPLDGLVEAQTLSVNNLDWEMVWCVSDSSLGRPHDSIAKEFGEGVVIHVVPHVVCAGRYACTRSHGIPFDEYTINMRGAIAKPGNKE